MGPVLVHGKCPYCGGALPQEQPIMFCPHCGHNVTIRLCPACSAELEMGWRYCPTCGRGLDAEQSDPSLATASPSGFPEAGDG